MKKSNMMIAIAASLGVGAATYYTMSKSQNPLNTAVENLTPLLNNIAKSENTGISSQIGVNGNQNRQQGNSQQYGQTIQ